jgi:hypothetical protein
MTALADPLGDLRDWLPRAAALITEPDTDATAGHGKAGSRPPWNPSAANACWDAIAVIAETRALFAYLVHGRPGPAYPYAATGAALDAIGRLGEAVPQDRARQAARELMRCVVVIKMLAAIDEAERPQMVASECPYCHGEMMIVYAKSGTITCGASVDCRDTNGRHPVGRAETGRLGPCVVWSDGLVS